MTAAEFDADDVLDLDAAIQATSTELARLADEAEALVAREHAEQSSTALVPVAERSPEQIKARLATTRSALARKRGEVESKAAEMQALMRRRMDEALAVVEPMRKQIARLEEGIAAVNLYLGRDEEIVTLRDGDPAPAETPISVRQQVLAMDEESAVAAEDGGIDARSIPEFDAWLLADPAHVEQIIPERRGVVCLVPRRRDRDYGDPWSTAAMREANSTAYFLVRNGDLLYRTTAEFKPGRRLVPARDEFTAMFIDRDGRPLRPGDYRWADAEAAAEARQRHYMKVALILQGLVDRTPVFHPLPAAAVDLLGVESYDAGHVQIIMDDDLALGDGRETFREWQARTNAELRVGMRIVGAFSTEGWRTANTGYDGRAHMTYRVRPNFAESPQTGVIYRLEDRERRGFVIRYARTEKRHGYEHGDWGTWGSWPYKTRASAIVEPDDSWIIALDLADPATLRGFLASRQDRTGYAEMFPAIRAAIAALEDEAEREAPFRALLAGRLVAEHALDLADAEAEVDDLVRWWKFTNRYHRPLVSEPETEARAIAGIVAEYGRRLADRARSDVDADLVRSLRDRHPTALVVARKRDGQIVVLEAADPEVSVYVHEYVYTSKGRPSAAGHSLWRLVGTRSARWSILWEHERWAGWERMASATEHLTGPEVDALVALARSEHVHDGEQAIAVTYSESPEVSEYNDQRGFVNLYVCDREPKHAARSVWEDDRPAGEPDEFTRMPVRQVRRRPLRWRRGKAGVTLSTGWHGYGVDLGRRGEDTWDAPGLRWIDRPLADALVAERARAKAHDLQVQQREHAGAVAARSIVAAWEARAEAAAYARFLDDYADPDLWDGHRKTLRDLGYPYHREDDWLERAAARALHAGIDLAGMTVAALTTLAVERQWLAELPPESVWADLHDLVFAAPEPDEDEVLDDDD